MKRRMLPAISVKNDSSEVRCECSLQVMLIGNHSAHEDLASVTESLQGQNSCIRGPGCGLEAGGAAPDSLPPHLSMQGCEGQG